MIVADTCLIFHLFNESTLTSSAQEILAKDPNWIFPPLWRTEYANVLSKMARKEHRTPEEIIHHFECIVDELKNHEIIVDTKKALEISMQCKISVYDAHFITLAINFSTVVVTEDKEILKKCPSLTISFADFKKR